MRIEKKRKEREGMQGMNETVINAVRKIICKNSKQKQQKTGFSLLSLALATTKITTNADKHGHKCEKNL